MEPKIEPQGFVPKRPTNFQQHQHRIELLILEGMHDGKGWKPESFSRYNELEDQETIAIPVVRDSSPAAPDEFLRGLATAQEVCQDAIGNWGGPQRPYFTEAMRRCWSLLEHVKTHEGCEEWVHCQKYATEQASSPAAPQAAVDGEGNTLLDGDLG